MERAKRDLEADLAVKKQQIEELEDAVQLAEDARLRLEVNSQAARSEFEKALQQKEAEGEDKRRGLLKQVREKLFCLFFCCCCCFC